MSEHAATSKVQAEVYPTQKASAVAQAAPAGAPAVTIGAVVHYVNPSGECVAATVTGLTGEAESVHLMVFPVSGVATSWKNLPWNTAQAAHTWHAAH